jgi:hypothetical protein
MTKRTTLRSLSYLHHWLWQQPRAQLDAKEGFPIHGPIELGEERLGASSRPARASLSLSESATTSAHGRADIPRSPPQSVTLTKCLISCSTTQDSIPSTS